MKSAVADAGPLIHLAEIGSLELLQTFDQLHIPEAVWSETVGLSRLDPDMLQELGTVERHSLPAPVVDQFVLDHTIADLHAGEREALCLCSRIDVPLILTDDLAVRDVAKKLSVTPVGSLGVVARGYRQGRISLTQAERLIGDLDEVSTLFVTRAIVDLAFKQLRSLAGEE